MLHFLNFIYRHSHLTTLLILSDYSWSRCAPITAINFCYVATQSLILLSEELREFILFEVEFEFPSRAQFSPVHDPIKILTLGNVTSQLMDVVIVQRLLTVFEAICLLQETSEYTYFIYVVIVLQLDF